MQTKKIFLILILIILLVALAIGIFFYVKNVKNLADNNGCKIQPYNGSEKIKDGLLDIRGGVICNAKIKKDFPVFTFKMKADEKSNLFTFIEIYKGDEKTPFQTIDVEDTNPLRHQNKEYRETGKQVQELDSPYYDKNFFVVEDENFDGYMDIRLLSEFRGELKAYDNWLFDPIKENFAYNIYVSRLPNPVFHQDTKTISSYVNGGEGGCVYFSETARFDDKGIFQPTEQIRQDKGDKGFIKSTTTFNNGTLNTIITNVSCP